MTKETWVGLFTGERKIPLEGVRVDARLSGPCVEVTVTQRYRNTESVPVEAVYVFPMEEGAAVCGFAARIGDALIEGRVDEREAAFDAYDDAMMDGHGAFLLDQERPDVFTASVGNLMPGQSVELQIRYVALARREGAATRLSIPTTVSPRFVPSGAAPDVGQPDGERVNPERWPTVPYGLALTVEVEGAALARVESPTHPVRTTLNDEGATVELSQDDVALDKDFVLLVEPRAPHQPLAWVAREEDGTRVAMISFSPELKASPTQGHEVVFLLDCSGSMGGVSIREAKKALSLCIRALGEHDTFNLVCFGSSHRALWTEPRRYDDTSLSAASSWVKSVDANLGGTVILTPLKEILEAPRDPERPRRVLLLTDGQVSNEADVIALARQHAEHTRVFTFGIGAGASEHLVRGVARESRGAAEMIAPGERIEPKVLRMFGRVRTPALDDVRVDYGGLQVEQSPRRTPPLFSGDSLTVFARIASGSAKEVHLLAGEERWTVPLDLERASTGGPVPTLWARERIREIESGEGTRGSAQRRGGREDRNRARLVELGKRYGLLSRATSFVAVQQRTGDERADAPAQLRKIPVALTDGWGGSGGAPRGVVRGAFTGQASVMTKSGWAAAPPAAMAPPPAPRMAAPAPASGGRGGMAKKSKARRRMARAESTMDFMEGSMDGSGIGGSASDRLFDLLMTQKADGRFETSAELTAWLGARADRLSDAIARHTEPVAVTALVLALLEREAEDRESEWRLAADKATAWLGDRGADVDVDTLLA